MTRFGLSEHIVDGFIAVMARYGQIEKAVIYGSRAKGGYRFNSDVDIAIFAPDMDEEEFLRLRFELRELPVVFSLDICHVDTLSNMSLKKKIQEEAVILYQA